MELSAAGEKPWFRHGDPRNAVNMWYWAAPSVEPEAAESMILMDAAGPDKRPVPRQDSSALSGKGVWKDGRWQVVFRRPLETDAVSDLQFVEGRYIPISFANWDGLAGESGGRHSFTSWYWLLLEPVENKTVLYGAPPAAGLLAGFLFLIAARRQRRRFGKY